MNVYLLSVIQYAGVGFLILLALSMIFFGIGYYLNIWKLIDITWGLGITFVVLTGWFMFWKFQWTYHVWVVGLVVLWGVRLSLYLLLRGSLKKEDPRYEIFKEPGRAKIFSGIKMILIQVAFMWLICIPLYFYMPIRDSTLRITMNSHILVVGVIISMLGLLVEWTADFQLGHFKKSKKLVKDGLWRYTRHPNYFGEILFWWGIWIATHIVYVPDTNIVYYNFLALISIITVLSPIAITCIITYITGPILEKQMEKYSEWEEYKEHTPYILPKIYGKKIE